MARIAYYRVSTLDQSIESQRQALGGDFDKEFSDSGVSGATLARSREGFASLLEYIREGDQLHVYALDRLGRDAIDVQQTVKALLNKGVALHINGLGCISKGVGELIIAVLAQIAEMERQRITERCQAGREAAKRELAISGKTHRGKTSLGRPKAAQANEVSSWRLENKASIAVTAKHFGISTATVTRYCKNNNIVA